MSACDASASIVPATVPCPAGSRAAVAPLPAPQARSSHWPAATVHQRSTGRLAARWPRAETARPPAQVWRCFFSDRQVYRTTALDQEPPSRPVLNRDTSRSTGHSWPTLRETAQAQTAPRRSKTDNDPSTGRHSAARPSTWLPQLRIVQAETGPVPPTTPPPPGRTSRDAPLQRHRTAQLPW